MSNWSSVIIFLFEIQQNNETETAKGSTPVTLVHLERGGVYTDYTTEQHLKHCRPQQMVWLLWIYWPKMIETFSCSIKKGTRTIQTMYGHAGPSLLVQKRIAVSFISTLIIWEVTGLFKPLVRCTLKQHKQTGPFTSLAAFHSSVWSHLIPVKAAKRGGRVH